MTFNGTSLTVSGDELLFYESRAKVLSSRQIGPQEVEFEMDSAGEGQTGRSVYRFRLSPDGGELADVTSGRQFVRVRCEQNPLPFVDEAPSDADFLAFRDRMLDAVANKDADYVFSIVTENILVSFGGDGGVEELTTVWRLDADDSRFWTELGAVLRLGGAFLSADTFAAPYTYDAWPSWLDVYEYLAVVASGVNVRSAPSMTAPVVSSVSYQTMRRADGGASDEWVPVRLADGGTGYIHERYVRRPLDYRALFERRDGRWRMRAFVAGD